MELQGRNLNIGMRGEDVELVQQELRQLGFAIEDEAGYFDGSTRQAVEQFQEQHNLELTGVVDERTAMFINSAVEALIPDNDGRSLVEGCVLNPDGRPEAGVIVKAFDKSVRGEALLGTATTGRDGTYDIHYTTDQLSHPDKTQADLIVRAIDGENNEIAASPLILDAPNEQVVDLVVGNEPYCGPSEYERLRLSLEPLLENQDPSTLTEEQIIYLARKTRFDPVHVAYFIRATILRQTIDSEAAIFYGLFRQNLPVELSDLFKHTAEILQDALITAVTENLIPAQFGKPEAVEQFFESSRQWLVKQAFEPPGEEGKSSLGDLLATTLETSEQQKMFLTAYFRHQGPMRDFWEGLKEDAIFANQAEELQLTVQLGAVTGNHLPLVSEILRLVRTGQPIKRDQTITNLKDLTVFNETDWQMLVQREDVGLPPDLPGESAAEKQQYFARAITRMLEDIYPTAFIANRIADDDQLEGRQDLLTFFTNNPQFELTTIRLATYLSDNPSALNGINDKELVQNNIQTMQRIHKLAPDYTAMVQIIQADIHSAQAITNMGPTVFTAKFGEMLVTQNLDATMVYECAQQTSATSLALWGAYGMGASKLPLSAVPDLSLGSLPQMPGIPDWQTLFGSLELCECKHCRSVYSPAAYLVDILHFLKDRHLVDQITRDPATGRIKKVTYQKTLANGKQVDKSAKDVLFARRPDLGAIELTCDNTNMPLPYIDLVNEILENLVAPLSAFTPFRLTTALENELDQGQLFKNLRSAFQTANQVLSTHAALTVKTKGKWWRVDDLACTYTIQKDAKGQLQVSARSLQTSGSTQERAATPQYVNPGAYTELKKQAFPWSLPFDLWLEETRAYLEHLGVSRADLMETFLPGKRTDLLSKTDLAHEVLGLTPESAKLINGQTSAAVGAWTLLGFNAETLSAQNAIPDPADNSKWIQNGHWLTAVLTQRVDVFLQQSDLEYTELLNVLETHYINPLSGGQRKITIISAPKNPATCELAKLKLTGFDQADAAKVVRFVRLWRKTDWSMSELDQAITVLHPRNQIGVLLTQPADINELMVRITHVKRLETMLDLSINALLGFWVSLTDKKLLLQYWTGTYTNYSTKDQPQSLSLYSQLFRNKAVINPLDIDFPEDAAQLDQTKKLSGNSATITAVLGISSTDFTLLLQEALVIPRVPDPGDAAKTIPDDRLTLVNLTRLRRHAVLAKALKLKIPEYLSILNLIGEPFLTTCMSVRFVERTRKLLSSGFTISELDYLLRHKFLASVAIAPTESAIALDLAEIRTALQKIAAENTFIDEKTTYLDGALIRKKLALLNWQNSLVSQVIATFNDTLIYEVTLQTFPQGVRLPNDSGSYEVDLPASALPANFAVPQSIKDIVAYDKTTQRLRATRALTQAETNLLATVPGAIASNLYQQVVAALAKLPDELRGRISYDATKKKLYFTGAMTLARRTKLKKVPGGQDYLNAVDKLFWLPRLFILRHMRTYEPETFTTDLAALPVGMVCPSSFKEKFYFDSGAEKLCFVGAMSTSEQTTLRTLKHKEVKPKVVQDYQQAIDTLFIAANTPPAAKDTFLSAPKPSAAVYNQNTDAGALFDNPTTPGDRYIYVLKKLLPYLCNSLCDFTIKQKLGEVLKVEAESIDGLLTKWIQARSKPGDKAILDFRADVFAESNLKVKLTRKIFPNQFATFTLLHKIALIITRLKVTPRQLAWIFAYGSKAGWLDYNTLPLAASAPNTAANPALTAAWESLMAMFQLRDALPLSESVLDALFKTAHNLAPTATTVQKNTAKAAYLDLLANETQWMAADIGTLAGNKNDQQDKGALDLQFPEDYQGEQSLERLHASFTKLKRLGMSAVLCHTIAAKQVGQQTARSIIQAVKAKYDDQQWFNLAKPLRDVLREKQRAALVAYLVKHPMTIKLSGGATQPAWRNVNGLYAHALIDIEMSPCQLTSRIKQANSSVQLFVQRCRMNLEKDVNANAEVDINWKQWKWMKNYRVWEANRKIFLYPENWIEPELRDDKSPFFKDLETTLLQNELTEENTGKAFLKYLEKLDGVALLEIVGMYHQLETDDSTAGGKAIIDVLHVFGRTRNKPHFYYYRQRMDSAYWTAWTKLDQDIQGDHLLPVVWKRRLYLFWPVFTKKQLKKPVTMPQGKEELKEGAEYWEIQLAWSEYKQGLWSPKSISDEAIISMLKPVKEIKDSGKLRHIFRTTPTEEGLFIWYQCDAYSHRHDSKILVEIAKAKVNNLLFCCVFLFDGCKGKVRIDYNRGWPDIIAPQGTELKGMMFVEKPESALYLPAIQKPSTTLSILAKTPGSQPFRLLYPHQDKHLTGKRPLFFQDKDRIFFIERQFERTPVYLLWPNWIENLEVDVAVFEGVLQRYLEELMKTATPVPPDLLGSDGFTPSYPIIEESEIEQLTAHTRDGDLLPAPAGIDVGGSFRHGFYENIGINEVLEPTPEPFGWLLDERYRFYSFYHPYVCSFISHLNRDGLDGMLQRPIQRQLKRFFVDKKTGYAPTDIVMKGLPTKDEKYPKYPKEEVDFSYGGAFAQYNWELFFHAPLLIADRLNKDQRFEKAQQWFHYIFDPTDASNEDVPRRYWRTKPFFETTDKQYQRERIPNLLRFLANRGDAKLLSALTASELIQLEELEKQVRAWRKDPFKPHLVARMRTTAYQKTVVMKYLDNLIDWGDQLFRRETMESTNEATQLYILAAEILGDRPEIVPRRAVPQVQTFNSLEPMLDEFSGALVRLEEFVPPSANPAKLPSSVQAPLPKMLYFCVPKNDKLLGYWDTIADRLFKIRHCMNIKGVERQLPLFAPPIDPGLLVKAAAAGIDISSALNDINAALPHYRFGVMSQKASELVAEVKSLGGALLSALEKRDAEALSLLRSTHELQVLSAVRLVKQKQIEDTKETLAGLNAYEVVVQAREQYYQKRVKDGIKPGEQEQLDKLDIVEGLQIAQAILQYIAAGFIYVPDWKAGSPTTAGYTIGGTKIGSSIRDVASGLGTTGAIASTKGTMTVTEAGYERRKEEWDHQQNLATKELDQVKKQIAAAEIRQAIAEQELKNHDLQVKNTKQVDAYMQDKFTNRELYDWMIGQISSIYFQSYQMAYDLAKRTEQAYHYELGLKDSSFIQFGYWDSLKKGLLAGERLYHDIKRMEVAYLDQHKREYEITKHISLAELDAMALVQLRQTGACYVSLPEALFDLDYPGHYLRRIKSAAITIPCITGPYTSVSCTLTLLKSAIRHSSHLTSGSYNRKDNDPRFIDKSGAIQTIVTSNAQDDNGLFENNLRDERYLPFEGIGAISEWRLELPDEFRQFDYDTIADIILHLRYTAREGGGGLKQQVIKELHAGINQLVLSQSRTGLHRLFGAKHEFSNAWHQFLHPRDTDTTQTLKLDLDQSHFPSLFTKKTIKIKTMHLFIKFKNGCTYQDGAPLTFDLKSNGDSYIGKQFQVAGSPVRNLAYAKPFENQSQKIGEWSIEVHAADLTGLSSELCEDVQVGSATIKRLKPDAFEDFILVCRYTAEKK